MTGAAWVDSDSDGDLDLWVSCPAGEPSPRILRFRNDGNGVLTAVPSGLVVESTFGMVWADADNDGDRDFYRINEEGSRSTVWRHDVAGFTQLDEAYLKVSGGADWGDYDGDGDLDLAVARFGTVELHRNDGSLNLNLATPLTGPGNARTPIWIDDDGDGDLDLALIGSAGNALFRNSGGTFTQATPPAMVDGGSCWQGAWGDYDDDGDPDLYLVKTVGPNRLLRNDGAAGYTDVTPSTPLGIAGDSRSANWVDVDNDGDLDLLVVRAADRSVLFLQQGGVFIDAGSSALDGNAECHGAAWADYDADGDLDVFIASSSAPRRLVRNDLTPGTAHWLHVDLVGSVSNRDAVGARIRMKSGGAWRTRDVSAHATHTQSSLTAEFGLGAFANAESLVVHWPSGLVRSLSHVVGDRLITLFETATTDVDGPASGLIRLSPPRPNPWRAEVTLRIELPEEQALQLDVVDVTGRHVRRIADRTLPAGRHEIRWDGRDAGGNETLAGIYWFRIRAGAFREAVRVVRLP